MTYRLNLNVSLESNVRRIAREQIDYVLAPSASGDAVWVHKTRKCLKRLRAML